jgi:hypothetical protein
MHDGLRTDRFLKCAVVVRAAWKRGEAVAVHCKETFHRGMILLVALLSAIHGCKLQAVLDHVSKVRWVYKYHQMDWWSSAPDGDVRAKNTAAAMEWATLRPHLGGAAQPAKAPPPKAMNWATCQPRVGGAARPAKPPPPPPLASILPAKRTAAQIYKRPPPPPTASMHATIGGAAQPAWTVAEDQQAGAASFEPADEAEAQWPIAAPSCEKNSISNIAFYNVGLTKATLQGKKRDQKIKHLEADVQKLWHAGADIIILLEVGDHQEGVGANLEQTLQTLLTAKDTSIEWAAYGGYIVMKRQMAGVTTTYKHIVIRTDVQAREWHKAIHMSLKAPVGVQMHAARTLHIDLSICMHLCATCHGTRFCE